MLPDNFDEWLSDKRVAILGFAREGQAAYRYFLRKIPASQIAIGELREEVSDVRDPSSALFVGESWLQAIDGADLLVRSPGIFPWKLPVLEEGQFLTSITEIFLSKERDRCIGVTGSKGKSTTSSLLTDLLRSQGKSVALVGNIGVPAIDLLGADVDYFVYEISSYQLYDCQFSPRFAVFLNLFEEHLDFHVTLAEYKKAKEQIYNHQKNGDFYFCGSGILPIENSPASDIRHENPFSLSNGTIIFKLKDEFLLLSELALRGRGNIDNLLAALAVVSKIGISDLKALKEAVLAYKPLSHRLSVIPSESPIEFVNDSISTIPEATINALDAYGNNASTLILGGFDRGISFDELAKEISKSSVDLVLLFKPSGIRMKEAIEKQCTRSIELILIDTMEEAVNLAAQKTPKGKACILSPSSPSFSHYRNFEERGNDFERLVRRLPA